MDAVSNTSLVSPKRPTSKLRSKSITSIHSRVSLRSAEGGSRVDSSTSKKSIASENSCCDNEPQQRGRLMTLSGFRQRKGTFSGKLQQPGASDKVADVSDKNGSGVPPACTVTAHGASSNGVCVVDTEFINNVSGLSTAQAQVLRQITVDDLNTPNTQLPVASSAAYSIDVAVLERKWTNLAMAQNIRGLQKVLSNTPAIINRSDFIYGFSALHWAAKLDNSPMAELLIYNMADVNSVSSSGSTPLHIAAQLGNERIIDLLIRSNASCDARNYAGKQPKDVAAPFLSRRCRDLLYSNVLRGVALRHGKKLTDHERAVLANVMPVQRSSNPAFSVDRRLGFRERLATSFRLNRPPKKSPTSLHRRPSSARKNSSASQLEQLRSGSEPRGIAALFESAVSVADAAPMSGSEPDLRRKSSGAARVSSPPLNSRTRRSVPKDGGRLPLAWVPAVRKRALEVDLQEVAAISTSVLESVTSTAEASSEEVPQDPLVANVKLLDSDVQVLVTCT